MTLPMMAALGPGASRRTGKLKPRRPDQLRRIAAATTDALADFDERGLWSFAGVRFSRAGTLLATAESFVNHAAAGHFVDLDNLLAVGTRPAAQARRRRAADAAQTRRPVPLLRGRPRAPDAPTARAAPVDGHARTRTAPARGRPDAGGTARRGRVVPQPARRAAAASVRRPRSAQVRVGRRPAHRPTARHRPVDGRRRPAATRRARRRDRPGAARRRRASADGKKTPEVIAHIG